VQPNEKGVPPNEQSVQPNEQRVPPNEKSVRTAGGRHCVICNGAVSTGVIVRSRGRLYCPKCYVELRGGQEDPVGPEPIDIAAITEAIGPGDSTPLWKKPQERLSAIRRAKILCAIPGALILLAIGFLVWLASGLDTRFLWVKPIDLLFGAMAGIGVRMRGGGMIEGAGRFAMAYLMACLVGTFAVVPFLTEGMKPLMGGLRQLLAVLGGLLVAAAAGVLFGLACRTKPKPAAG